MDAPRYPLKPIASLAALGKALDTSPAELRRLARAAPKLYPLSKEKGIERKADGSERIYYAPKAPIKELQQKLHARLLGRVEYPPYLIAGVKGHSYRDNCLLHTRAKTVINLDISTFFEAVSEGRIRSVWQRFFRFSPEVAELLTRLTTHKGALPRGAPSSPLLANLVFWDVEPQLAAELAQHGITYSRYVDDVTLSAGARLDKKTIAWAVGRVFAMFRKKGVHPNRKKLRVRHAPNALRVHNVNVHGHTPTLPKRKRREIRAATHNLGSDPQTAESMAEQLARLQHVNGSIAWMNQFHPEEARTLWSQIPLPNGEPNARQE